MIGVRRPSIYSYLRPSARSRNLYWTKLRKFGPSIPLYGRDLNLGSNSEELSHLSTKGVKIISQSE